MMNGTPKPISVCRFHINLLFRISGVWRLALGSSLFP